MSMKTRGSAVVKRKISDITPVAETIEFSQNKSVSLATSSHPAQYVCDIVNTIQNEPLKRAIEAERYFKCNYVS